MVLQLTFNEFLQLRDAQGAAIEVLDGKVWITETGKPGDRFLESGRSYQVAGSGLVVVGAESTAHFARVQVRKPARRFWYFLKSLYLGWQTRQELYDLSDGTLRDIGVRRDEIDRRF